jgi:hypothetical protein
VASGRWLANGFTGIGRIGYRRLADPPEGAGCKLAYVEEFTHDHAQGA